MVKSQVRSLLIGRLGHSTSALGVWIFSGAWSLVFGAFTFSPPIYPSHRPRAGKHWGFCMFYPSQRPSQAVPRSVPSVPRAHRPRLRRLRINVKVEPSRQSAMADSGSFLHGPIKARLVRGSCVQELQRPGYGSIGEDGDPIDQISGCEDNYIAVPGQMIQLPSEASTG